MLTPANSDCIIILHQTAWKGANMLVATALAAAYLIFGAYVGFCSRDELETRGEFNLSPKYMRWIVLSVRFLGMATLWPIGFIEGEIYSFTMALRLRAPMGRRRELLIKVQIPAIERVMKEMIDEDLTWQDVRQCILDISSLQEYLHGKEHT